MVTYFDGNGGWRPIIFSFKPDPPKYSSEKWVWVESREAIKPRPSLLNLGVRLSPHPASDILGG
jgi:hypothetical protein